MLNSDTPWKPKAGVTKQSNAVTSNEIKIQEVKKNPNERKNKNSCDILIMTFTNLKKYAYSKKCWKQRRQPPQPPAKSKVFSCRKSHLAIAVVCKWICLLWSSRQSNKKYKRQTDPYGDEKVNKRIKQNNI